MKPVTTPVELWNAGLQTWCTMAQAQTEATLRLWAAMGVLPKSGTASELAAEAEAFKCAARPGAKARTPSARPSVKRRKPAGQRKRPGA